MLIEKALFSSFLSTSVFTPMWISDDEVMWHVVEGFYGILLRDMYISTHHTCCHAVLNNKLHDSVDNIFVAVCWRCLSTLS